MKNILVLCTGNSCRSQLAEGYLRFFASDKANHIDISKHTSNHVDEYVNILFDYVITVCDNANEACPFFPGNVQRFHHNFPDPAKAKGTPEEILNEFRNVRDIIKVYAANFVKQHIG
jgi:arsenate reductase